MDVKPFLESFLTGSVPVRIFLMETRKEFSNFPADKNKPLLRKQKKRSERENPYLSLLLQLLDQPQQSFFP